MDTAEFNRLVDAISRERGLDKEMIFTEIEKALVQAAGKRFDQVGDFSVTIDRKPAKSAPLKMMNRSKCLTWVASLPTCLSK